MNNSPPIRPGLILQRDFLQPQGITEDKLSNDLKVPLTMLRSILHENGSITAEFGELLDLYFNKPMGHWRKLQIDYEHAKSLPLKRERTSREKTASDLKWSGLLLAFLPFLLFLLILFLGTQFDGSSMSGLIFNLAWSLPVCWVISILIGLPLWARGVIASQRPVLWMIAESVLVLGVYAACMVFALPLTLTLIGGLGFSFGGS